MRRLLIIILLTGVVLVSKAQVPDRIKYEQPRFIICISMPDSSAAVIDTSYIVANNVPYRTINYYARKEKMLYTIKFRYDHDHWIFSAFSQEPWMYGVLNFNTIYKKQQ